MAGVEDNDRHVGNYLIEVLPTGVVQELEYVFGDINAYLSIGVVTRYHVWSIDYGCTRSVSSSSSPQDIRRGRRTGLPTRTLWGALARLDCLPEYTCM